LFFSERDRLPVGQVKPGETVWRSRKSRATHYGGGIGIAKPNFPIPPQYHFHKALAAFRDS
jgi:hypothetical protein